MLTETKLFIFHLCTCAFFQDLNNRAQGEVTIRASLRELDLWGAAAAFNLTEYTDSNKCSLKLIKDWKDIVNQVDIQTQNFYNPAFSLSFNSTSISVLHDWHSQNVYQILTPFILIRRIIDSLQFHNPPSYGKNPSQQKRHKGKESENT